MNSYERMNESATADMLIETATELFARDGFSGTSVRAITARAGTNLGAITYHFGSKRELFHAVLENISSPVRARIEALKDAPGSALDKIDDTVRALFAALHAHPEIPRLIVHVLASQDPLPPPIARTMKTVIGHITNLIEAGQREGSVRPGLPQMLALTCGSQPIFFGIYRRALEEAVGLDQSDEKTSRKLTETVIEFINGGLSSGTAQPEHSTKRTRR